MNQESATAHFARKAALQKASDECQGEQQRPMLNTKSEDPQLSAVRLENRLRLFAQGMESVSNLADSRAREIEDLHVRMAAMNAVHAEQQERLIKRSREAVEAVTTTASALIEFIINMKAAPVNLRNYAEAGTPVNAEAMAQIIDGIAIGLHAIKRMAGGNGEGAVRFPTTPQGLEDWLKELQTRAQSGLNTNQRLNEAPELAGGYETLYWCPRCQRHVHPESLHPSLDDIHFLHPHADGGATVVEVRRRFSGPEAKEPPVEWVDWQTKMGRLLVKHGIDADRARAFNFFQAFGNGQTPEETIDQLLQLY